MGLAGAPKWDYETLEYGKEYLIRFVYSSRGHQFWMLGPVCGNRLVEIKILYLFYFDYPNLFHRLSYCFE